MYLLPTKYNKTFIDFFSSPFTDIEKRREDYSTRKNFFKVYLKFFYEKIFFWNVEKYSKDHLILPDIGRIVINAKLDEALVSSSYDETSGIVSRWAKENKEWKFVKVVLTSSY